MAISGEVSDLGKAVRAVGEGLTAEAVLAAADEHDALAIVVGATGHGPMRGALLGSVTYQVVHRSTRPVVVVPAPAAD